MKYSHIIYTSSEKNQAGKPGFGVRYVSEGILSAIPATLEENEFFSFQEAGPALSAAALASNPEAIKLIVPTYFFRQLPLPDSRRVFVMGRKVAVGFDHNFYLEGKPGKMGNYVVDAYIFDKAPSSDVFEILLEDAAPGSNRFIPLSPVPALENAELKDLALGEKLLLPAEEKPFKAQSRPTVSSKAIDLLFAFIRSRKEGKPVLVKADVAAPPVLMAELASLVPQKQMENLTFVTNHTDEGKIKGVNICFINEYYGFEVFKNQWIWLDLDATEPAAPSQEAILFRKKVEEYVEQGNLKAVHDLVGWCLSDMYEKGRSFSEETQNQLFNYLYDFDRFDITRVASDVNLRQTLNDYFISEPEEKIRFDEDLQHRFHSMKSLDNLWDWIDLMLALNPIDCKGLMEKNRVVITGAVFQSPTNFLQFYNRYRNRFGDVQKFIDRQAFSTNESYLSDEVLRPVWQQLYSFFLKDKLGEDNKDYLVERMIHDNLDPVSLQQVLNKERISAKEYITCLVAILAKHDEGNEKTVADMLSNALRDRNDIELDFFERFPDKIMDLSYTPLYEWQLRNYSLHTKEKIERLTEYLLRFKNNPQATKWALEGEGRQVFVRLYTALKDAMRKGNITQKEVSDICDDLRQSGYPAKNIDSFNILDTIARREEVSEVNKIRKIWEVTSEIDDREYLKTLIPQMAANICRTGDEAMIDNFCGFILDRDLMTNSQLWEFASKTEKPEAFKVAMMRHSKLKPQAALDFLVNERGLTDDAALEFFSTHFPKIHESIMKSRQPSIMQKLSSMMRGIFGKRRENE